MTFGYYAKLYFLTLVAFLAIDGVWLGLVARNLYSKYLGYLMTPKTVWPAAILFYLLYVVGVLVFAVLPGLQAGSLGRAALLGALLGLVAYATYDLTNLATVKEWPLLITVIDLIWGTVLTAAVSAVGFLIGRWLG
ncbi:MAG: DUF2177 family protein [Anaerolineae bacterium]|nr:DUF2177 family protein [Anaerolineae bacterium]